MKTLSLTMVQTSCTVTNCNVWLRFPSSVIIASTTSSSNSIIILAQFMLFLCWGDYQDSIVMKRLSLAYSPHTCQNDMCAGSTVKPVIERGNAHGACRSASVPLRKLCSAGRNFVLYGTSQVPAFGICSELSKRSASPLSD